MTKRNHLAILFSSFTLSLGALGACAGDEPPNDGDTVETPPVLAARAHLAAAVPQVSSADLKVTRARKDQLGMTHVRHQQSFHGIPVIGGEAIVHLAADGSPRDLTDALVRDVRVDTTPALGADAAVDRALAATVGVDGATTPPLADLRIIRRKDGDHLVWQVAIESLPTGDVDAWSKPIVLVDAHSGDVLYRWDRVVDVTTSGTGTARYAGSVSFKTWLDGDGKYYLEDNIRKVAVYDLKEGEASDPVARYSDSDNVWSGVTTAVQAHWALEQTWDYYHAMFSREGIDGNYGPGYINSKTGDGKLVSGLVHWEPKANNARWIDPQIVFGDGDGTQFSPLVSLDIVAHEWTHGVTSREAGLGGVNEAPALNEHISDVFGASAEAWLAGGVNANTWLIVREHVPRWMQWVFEAGWLMAMGSAAITVGNWRQSGWLM